MLSTSVDAHYDKLASVVLSRQFIILRASNFVYNTMGVRRQRVAPVCVRQTRLVWHLRHVDTATCRHCVV